MYKVLRPLKDAYITNRLVNGTRQTSANVGAGGSLDLFKLYGITSSGSSPNTELTRVLIKFDLDPLQDLVSEGKVDFTNSTFACYLSLSDVYGGQPTPSNFTVSVHPLSASFDEGVGRDVVYYSDYDVCNWLTSSAGNPWFVTGCASGGAPPTACDYFSSSLAQQTFTTGEEDLYVNVTAIVSSTLAGTIPDSGFRISFAEAIEGDTHTYFVKRFASRTAYNQDLHPKLIVKYDDSIQDDTNNMYMDAAGTMFLRNYVRNVHTNVLSSSTPVTGSNCLILQLVTPVSGGTYSLYFTGSQHYSGINAQAGLYSASVTVPSTIAALNEQLVESGSITFTPVWKSLDGTVSYTTGSTFKVYPAQRGAAALDPKRYDVSVVGMRDSMKADEQSVIRVNVFDRYSPVFLQPVKLPAETPGVIIRDAFYQVRDVVTKRVVIPFDTTNNSTRISNDSSGMYFKLDAENLTTGHTYVIDVLFVIGDNEQYYEAVSPAFRVGATT